MISHNEMHKKLDGGWKKKAPNISVLTTVYNGEKYIEKTIESVLKQTFSNFEYIIVDDGSTDNTAKIIKSFKDKRIKYYYHGKNQGYFNFHHAINFGLDKCEGEYVARIDADDICFSNRLEVQSRYLDRNRSIFLIGSSADVINEFGWFIGVIKKKNFPSFCFKYRISFSNPFIHSSIIFRNEGFKYPCYDERFFYFSLIIKGKNLKNLQQK